MLDPAHFTPYYDYALGQALAQLGHDVELVTSPFGRDPNLEPPPEIRVSLQYLRRFGASNARRDRRMRMLLKGLQYPIDHLRLLRRVRAERPDVVHIQWSRLPAFDLPLIHGLHRAGCLVVHTIHEIGSTYLGGNAGLDSVYSSCDAVVVLGHALVEPCMECYPSLSRQRVHVIPHGPLQAYGRLEGADRSQARRRLGIPQNAAVALFFGEIRSHKGLDDLIRAFPLVHRANRAAFLLIVGDPESPREIPDVSPLVRTGIPHKLILGYVPTAEVWQYYAAADVVVLPYRNAGQSGVLLSALANGRAVVATAVGAVPEVVSQTEGGWLVEPGDEPALVQCIVEALADRSATDAKGQAACAQLQRTSSWESVGRATADMYVRLLATKTARRVRSS